jgi:NADH-quinone oxidoreductase subunit J
MAIFFYIAAVIAVFATMMVITRPNAVHALLYLIVSLLAVAVDFYLLGAPFVAALEVIIYAGAIMVLFVFVIMMLNLGEEATRKEYTWLRPTMLILPGLLTFVLFGEVLYTMIAAGGITSGVIAISPQLIGIALFGPYILGVEMSSLVLLAGLVGAYHLGRRSTAAERMGADDTYTG